MAKVEARCTKCGCVIMVDNKRKKNVCEYCNTELVAEDAIKLYEDVKGLQNLSGDEEIYTNTTKLMEENSSNSGVMCDCVSAMIDLYLSNVEKDNYSFNEDFEVKFSVEGNEITLNSNYIKNLFKKTRDVIVADENKNVIDELENNFENRYGLLLIKKYIHPEMVICAAKKANLSIEKMNLDKDYFDESIANYSLEETILDLERVRSEEEEKVIAKNKIREKAIETNRQRAQYREDIKNGKIDPPKFSLPKNIPYAIFLVLCITAVVGLIVTLFIPACRAFYKDKWYIPTIVSIVSVFTILARCGEIDEYKNDVKVPDEVKMTIKTITAENYYEALTNKDYFDKTSLVYCYTSLLKKLIEDLENNVLDKNKIDIKTIQKSAYDVLLDCKGKKVTQTAETTTESTTETTSENN